MDVIEALEHAESDLARTLDELRMHKEIVSALEQDVKSIQIEIAGLRSYAQRRGLAAAPEPMGDVVPIMPGLKFGNQARADIALMSRSDAVAAVLAAGPGPMDRAAIQAQFVDAGRFDSMDDISLALSGLKRAGRVHKLGQGLWSLAEATSRQSAGQQAPV